MVTCETSATHHLDRLPWGCTLQGSSTASLPREMRQKAFRYKTLHKTRMNLEWSLFSFRKISNFVELRWQNPNYLPRNRNRWKISLWLIHTVLAMNYLWVRIISFMRWKWDDFEFARSHFASLKIQTAEET